MAHIFGELSHPYYRRTSIMGVVFIDASGCWIMDHQIGFHRLPDACREYCDRVVTCVRSSTDRRLIEIRALKAGKLICTVSYPLKDASYRDSKAGRRRNKDKKRRQWRKLQKQRSRASRIRRSR